MAQCCLLIVFGTPGAGKSSLCRALVHSLADRYDVTHVEYDVTCEPQSLGGDDDTTAAAATEDDAAAAVGGGAAATENDCGSKNNGAGGAVVAAGVGVPWRELRNRALSRVDQLLLLQCDSGVTNGDGEVAGGRRRVLLVDDTMHLRSMRRQCWRLACSRRAAFAQLLVDTPLTVCLARNAQRRRPVSERVLRAVHHRLETARDAWEIHSDRLAPVAACDWRQTPLVVGALLQRAFAQPLAPPPDHSLAADEARRVCSTNERHQLDCALRRLVSEYVGGRGERARLANQARRSIMTRLSDGTLQFSANCEIECFDSFARDLFTNELASGNDVNSC